MATRNDPSKTFLSQGKFIHPQSREAFEARARALRAEAIRQAARAVGEKVRGFFARSVDIAPRHKSVQVRAH